MLRSLPSRERGLKSQPMPLTKTMAESLPSRERGLKYLIHLLLQLTLRRSLRGSVD